MAETAVALALVVVVTPVELFVISAGGMIELDFLLMSLSKLMLLDV